MALFTDARGAKDFIVSRIVAEAHSEGLALSEVERKMLYFSETDWILPNMMETAQTFERECDEDDYEKKIVRLIVNLQKRLRKGNKEELQVWSEAIRVISKEDHYVLVMIQQAGASLRPPGDLLKLWGTGLGICLGLLFLIYLFLIWG